MRILTTAASPSNVTVSDAARVALGRRSKAAQELSKTFSSVSTQEQSHTNKVPT
jgi:hypothetical protein